MKYLMRILTGIRDLFTAPKAYIPQYISNDTVLKVYDMLSRISRVSRAVRKSNREINIQTLAKGTVFAAGNFIENQNDWEDIQFGSGKHHNMRYSGCEIIAMYNGLLDLGEALSVTGMAELIMAFEQKGAALKGDFGVAPHAVRDYFKNKGYRVYGTSHMDGRRLDRLGRKSHTIIATVYNNKMNIMEEIHTVCITKKGDAYVVHNDYTRDAKKPSEYRERGGYATLQEAVGSIGRDAKGIYVIGITKNYP